MLPADVGCRANRYCVPNRGAFWKRVIRVRKLGVRARWAVPAGVVATVGIVIAASAVASAQSAPSLPPRSAAQLLADVAHAKPLGAFTATIQQTSNLGLPALPTAASQDGGAPAALTSGQGVSIWYRDPQHIRLAVPVQAGESDLRLDGRTLWLWNSKTQTATHVVLPAHFSAPGNGAGIFLPSWHSVSSSSGPADLPNSPLAAAKQAARRDRPVHGRDRAAQRLRGWPGGLPAVCRAEGERFAGRQDPHRDRRQQVHPAARAGVRPRRVEPRIRCRLHGTDVRAARHVQLHLHAAARRDGEDREDPEQAARRPRQAGLGPGGPEQAGNRQASVWPDSGRPSCACSSSADQ